MINHHAIRKLSHNQKARAHEQWRAWCTRASSKKHSPESAGVAVARSCASRRKLKLPAAHTLAAVRNSRWLLPYACRGPDARASAAAQRVAAWPALGWWILKKTHTTSIAAAPLFLKLKIIISFNIQKSNFYPPCDYISFYSSCIPFFFFLGC